MIINLFALIVAIIILIIILKVFDDPIKVIMNSIAGIIAFFILNIVFNLGIVIDFWSILIVGIGGLGGLIFVLILHFLGIAF